MGRTYQAMLRAESDRTDQRVPGTPELGEPGWEVEEPGGEADEAAAEGAPGDVDWGAFVFDQVGSIDQRLDAFDEVLHKRVPELEGRLLHLLELRLGSLERGIATRLIGLSRDLGSARGVGQRWLAGLLGLNLLLVAVTLLKLG